MVSRRRRGKRWPLALAAIAGLVALWWLAWPGESPETASGGDENENQSVEQAADPNTEPSPRAQGLEHGDAAAEPSSAAASGGGNPSPPTWTLDRVPDEPAASDRTTSAQQDRQTRQSSRQPSNDQTADISPASRTESLSRGVSTPSVSDTDDEPRQSEDAEDEGNQGDVTDRARATARGASGDLERGMSLIAEGSYIEGRRVLSSVLYGGRITDREARTIRETLTDVNERLVFSPRVFANDPVVDSYTVQSGDVLEQISRKYKVPYQFIQRINDIADPRRIQVGQKLKLIEGPFHVRVDKSEYRMDLFLHGSDGTPLYVCSYPVGLGEENSTPVGEWVIKPGHKVSNPGWKNPRTGEYYKPDDPDNPIGDYWLALEGIDEQTSGRQGYGIHGTVDPDSIGRQASMGCIRLRNQDVEQVYHMLVGGETRVTIAR